MSELPGTAAVGIESVEWLDGGGGNLTVRITGRWRRRRPAAGGQTALVVEAEGRRHRFPAMPEPPSLGGAAPGTWRLSFSVPGSLAPDLGGRTWLAFGTVTVPLPTPESAVTESAPAAGDAASAAEVPIVADPPPAPAPPPSAAAADPVPSAAPEPPPFSTPAAAAERAAGVSSEGSELEIERAWRRAEDAERASTTLAVRVTRLEDELRAARRAREEAGPTRVTGAEGDRLRFEQRLRVRHVSGAARVPAEPSLVSGEPAATAGSTAAAAAAAPVMSPAPLSEPELVRALRRELDARAGAEAALRARAVQAESRLAARVLLEQRTVATLHRLRDELDELRELVERERARRRSAEDRVARLTGELGGQRERSQGAYDAIGELRGALDRLRPPSPAGGAPTGEEAPAGAHDAPPPGAAAASSESTAAAPDPPTAGPVAPERLGDALARLRETTAPRDPPPDLAPGPGAAAPAPLRTVPGRPTLQRAFRRLVGHDADAAGRLLLDLLPLQRAAYPHPVSYDLVLGPGHGCVQVDVGAGEPVIELRGAARAREQVDLRIVGQPARVARLLTAGRWRRRLGFRVARVRGRREGLAALDALLALPLDVAALSAAGMRAEPETLLSLVAAMVEPAWTRGERFSLAHTDERARTVHLHVRDGRAMEVSRTAPDGRVATEIAGSATALAEILAGESDPPADDPALRGDRGPLSSLRDWIKRAQSG